jgi:hypothetical protein
MRRSVAIVFVLFVAAAVFAGGTAVWASNRAGPLSASAKPAGLNQLGETATVLDVLPPGVSVSKLGNGGVDPASVRFIQAGTAGAYWVALDAGGNVCLIVTVGSASGAGCVTPSAFEAHGLAYRLTSKAGPVAEGYLFPDTVFTGSKASNIVLANVVDAEATISYHDNLLLLNPRASKAQRQALESQLEGWFALDVLPPVS